MKCDESRPSCRRCSRANFQCSFHSDGPIENPLEAVPRTKTKFAASRETGNRLPSAKRVFEPLPMSMVDQSSSTSSPSSTSSYKDEERFSMLHLRLLRHFENDLYESEKHMHPGFDSLLNLYVDCGWTTPYLLEEILAYAAAHRSTLLPSSRQLLLHESKRLQTRALTEYNRQAPVLSHETCVPMFLFVSLLSHHLIFEASLGVQDDMDSALEALTHSIGIHRGLISIAKEAWPMFSEDIRQQFLLTCQREYMPRPSGPDSKKECGALLARLDTAAMDSKSRSSCRETVVILQDRFDSISMHDTHSMWAAVQDWLVAIPQDYVEQLKQGQPEALVVLAHFAVLLHYVAEHWFVGDLGVRLVRLINGHLGPAWAEWMAWPTGETLQTPEKQAYL